MLFSKVLPLLFFIINVAFATLIHVYRDTSCPTFVGGPHTVYLWSAVATFAHRPTNGQIVQLAEDAWRSMLEDVIENGIARSRLPTVMSALALQNDNNVWEIYFASSSKGTASLVYNYGQASQYACGDQWDTVPEELRNAINACSAQAGGERHRFDAKCGEMNVFMELYMRTGQDISKLADRSRTVAWAGQLDDSGNYASGSIWDPCWTSGQRFGCSNVLEALSKQIEVIPKDTQRESYTDNMPVSVDFQPLFPDYES